MALDKETAKLYRLEVDTPDGKTVSVGFDEVVAAREAEQDAATAALDPADPAKGASYGDSPEAKAAMDAQIAFVNDPTNAEARATFEKAMHALGVSLAENHIDINRARDDSYDDELRAKGYTDAQIVRQYRKQRDMYRRELVDYATRARNMENEVRACLDPLRMSTKMYRESMRQMAQVMVVKDDNPGLAVMLLEELEDKLRRLGEDESFRADVRRFRESLNASKLDAIEMPIVEDARVGNYHGE